MTELTDRQKRLIEVAQGTVRDLRSQAAFSRDRYWLEGAADTIEALLVASGMSAGTAETQSGSGPEDRQPDGDSRDAHTSPSEPSSTEKR